MKNKHIKMCQLRWIIPILLLFATIFLSGSPANCAVKRLDPALADSLAQAVDDPLVRADYYIDAWLDEKAIAELEKAEQKNAEILWRLAKARINIGENLEGDEALVLFEQAMNEAQSAVDLEPDNSLAQQTLAVACGRVALFKGVFKSLGLVKRVHKAVLRAVACGDSVPISLYVLGRTHKKLIEKPGFIRAALGLGWAKEDSVAYYFERALKVSDGNMIQCRVEYADYLINRKGDKEAAKQMLKAALDLPLRDEQDSKGKQRASEMLKKLAE
ncbi:MAG: hypothetical protein P9X24_07115 [Candidatus Hatepunaea meridiana]|nr:hypothetical protein [Candidatus Hatepunaea meridiana]